METKDWIILLIPIVFSVFMSISTTLVNNRLHRRNNERQITIEIMTKLKEQVSNVKEIIIKLQCGLGDFSDELSKFYIEVGNLQIYIRDKREVLEKINDLNKKDILCLSALNKLMEIVTCMGKIISDKDITSKKAELFAQHFSNALNLCEETISNYEKNSLELGLKDKHST